MIPDVFVRHWMPCGATGAVVLLLLTPVVAPGLSLPLLAVFLALPVYMLHQIEEHAGDRFRRYFNATMGGGREALTPFTVMVANVVGVWGVIIVALHLAAWVRPGLGLIAVWLVLVNAAVHLIAMAAQRRANPGVWTAIVLFLPYGAWALTVLSERAGATDQAIGIAAGVLIHVAIMAHARRRLATLTPAA